jgi:S-adenosylmethionine-diacylgycerolhomoserine-N-methlytransferase
VRYASPLSFIVGDHQLMVTPIRPDPSTGCSQVERYYRFHSKIYDATRWTYLFGRGSLIDRLARLVTPTRILEVGCGTGANLVRLRNQFPAASIVGLDMSAPMLEIARRKLGTSTPLVQLVHSAYDRPVHTDRRFDLVVFSYCLTMINPGWDTVIDLARSDLEPGGWIAVVDFHDTPLPFYRRWMRHNHVFLEGHLLPRLRSRFETRVAEVHAAYLGWWRYFTYIGIRPA